jgi:hypothetical protein
MGSWSVRVCEGTGIRDMAVLLTFLLRQSYPNLAHVPVYNTCDHLYESSGLTVSSRNDNSMSIRLQQQDRAAEHIKYR